MYIYILNKCVVRLGYWSPPNLYVTPEQEEEEELKRHGLIGAILSEKIFDSLY